MCKTRRGLPSCSKAASKFLNEENRVFAKKICTHRWDIERPWRKEYTRLRVRKCWEGASVRWGEKPGRLRTQISGNCKTAERGLPRHTWVQPSTNC